MKKLAAYFIGAFALFMSLASHGQERQRDLVELTPGCLWNKSAGRCVIKNNFNDSIECEITVTGKTFRGVTIGNTRKVVVHAKMFDDSTKVFAARGDVLTHVKAHAECFAI
jgi:hypothetical protein